MMSRMFSSGVNLGLHGTGLSGVPFERETPRVSGFVPYGSPAAAAAIWSVRTGRPCPVAARWCSCGHSMALQGKPIDRYPRCGGFCEGSEWR